MALIVLTESLPGQTVRYRTRTFDQFKKKLNFSTGHKSITEKGK